MAIRSAKFKDLQLIAATWGCSVVLRQRFGGHYLFALVLKDDESKEVWLDATARGTQITRIRDISLDEWREVIKSAAHNLNASSQ
ncbi:MAG TPA: hypothetical protein VGL07_16820 [Buttiauxella sp.]|jgi:hypothetical protein